MTTVNLNHILLICINTRKMITFVYIINHILVHEFNFRNMHNMHNSISYSLSMYVSIWCVWRWKSIIWLYNNYKHSTIKLWSSLTGHWLCLYIPHPPCFPVWPRAARGIRASLPPDWTASPRSELSWNHQSLSEVHKVAPRNRILVGFQTPPNIKHNSWILRPPLDDKIGSNRTSQNSHQLQINCCVFLVRCVCTNCNGTLKLYQVYLVCSIIFFEHLLLYCFTLMLI